ncbi:hypothetical protein PG995_011265 [Apiospora arundinis]
MVVPPPLQAQQQLPHGNVQVPVPAAGLPGNPNYYLIGQQAPAQQAQAQQAQAQQAPAQQAPAQQAQVQPQNPYIANNIAPVQPPNGQQINQQVQTGQDQIFQSFGQPQLPAQSRLWYAGVMPMYANTLVSASSTPSPPRNPLPQYPSPPSPPPASYSSYNPGQNVVGGNVSPFQPVDGQGQGQSSMNTPLPPQSSPGTAPYYGTPTPCDRVRSCIRGAPFPLIINSSSSMVVTHSSMVAIHNSSNSPSEAAALALAMSQGIPMGHQYPNDPLNAAIDPRLIMMNPNNSNQNNMNQNNLNQNNMNQNSLNQNSLNQNNLSQNNSNQHNFNHTLLDPELNYGMGRFGPPGQQQFPQQQQQGQQQQQQQQQQQPPPQNPPDGGNGSGYGGMADADEDPEDQEVDDESETEGPEV